MNNTCFFSTRFRTSYSQALSSRDHGSRGPFIAPQGLKLRHFSSGVASVVLPIVYHSKYPNVPKELKLRFMHTSGVSESEDASPG